LEENIARLQETLLILENTLVELLTTIPDDPEAIIRQRLQIAQSRSALLSSQSTLVTRRVAFQNSVDDFLRDLGLPPYICVRLNDPSLDRFELIDRRLRQRREELIKVRTAVGRLNVALLDQTESSINPDTGQPEQELVWDDEVAALVEELLESLKPLSRLTQQLTDEDLPRVAVDLERLGEQLPKRRQQILALEALVDEEQAMICSLLGIEAIDESIFDLEPLDNLGSELDQNFQALAEQLAAYQPSVNELVDTFERYLAAGPSAERPSPPPWPSPARWR